VFNKLTRLLNLLVMTEGRRLSGPRWLGEILMSFAFARPQAVVDPSTNRARRRVTSLKRPTTLPLRQTATAPVTASHAR